MICSVLEMSCLMMSTKTNRQHRRKHCFKRDLSFQNVQYKKKRNKTETYKRFNHLSSDAKLSNSSLQQNHSVKRKRNIQNNLQVQLGSFISKELLQELNSSTFRCTKLNQNDRNSFAQLLLGLGSDISIAYCRVTSTHLFQSLTMLK